jgi:hypothetical protein
LSALRPALTKLAEVARQLGYSWVDFEVNALLEGAPGVSALLDCLSSHEQWRHTLLALLEARESPVGTQSERVVWHLREASGSWSILPKLQKLDKKGNWSAGRCIDYGSGYPACANPAEEKAIALVRRGDGLDALALLVGHPLVFFFDAPSEPVAVVAGRPVLTIKRVDDHLHLSLAPYPAGGNAVVREGPRRIVFYVFDQPQRNVASLLGPSGLLVPASESAMVEQVATNLSSSFEVLTDFAVSAKQQLLEELTRRLGGSSLELVL